DGRVPRGDAVLDARAFVARLAQRFGEEAQARRVVVGDQDARHRGGVRCHRRAAFMRTLAQCRRMRAPSNRIRFAIAVAALGFACAWPACAASVRVRVASIEHPFARIDDLDLRLDEADGRREAHLAIGRLALPDAGLAGRLTWQCALAREADAWT